jgi:hypothetical protein
MNWRGKPLRSYRTMVQLIAATTTDTVLKVRAELDERRCPQAVKVSDAQTAAINLRGRCPAPWQVWRRLHGSSRYGVRSASCIIGAIARGRVFFTLIRCFDRPS